MPLRWLTRMDSRFVPRLGTPDGVGLLAGSHTARGRAGDTRTGEDPPAVVLTVEVPPLPQLRGSYSKQTQWRCDVAWKRWKVSASAT
jgi:hypothetical protein